MLKNALIAAAAIVGLGFLIDAVWRLEASLAGTQAGTQVSTQGDIAMVLGILGTIVVGGGLTAFFFWAAHRQSEEEERDARETVRMRHPEAHRGRHTG